MVLVGATAVVGKEGEMAEQDNTEAEAGTAPVSGRERR